MFSRPYYIQQKLFSSDAGSGASYLSNCNQVKFLCGLYTNWLAKVLSFQQFSYAFFDILEVLQTVTVEVDNTTLLEGHLMSLEKP